MKVLGNFEDWSRALAGILKHAGIEEFLGNQGALYEQVDEEGPEWEAFLAAWRTHLESQEYTTGEITTRLGTCEPLRNALPGPLARALSDQDGSFDRRFGKALARHADVTFANGHRLVKAGKDAVKGRLRWRVATQTDSGEGGFPVSLFSRLEPEPPTGDSLANRSEVRVITDTRFASIREEPEAERNGGNQETGKPRETESATSGERFCFLCGGELGAEPGDCHAGCTEGTL